MPYVSNRVGSVTHAGPQVLVESTRTLLVSAHRPRQNLRKLGHSTRPLPGGEASVRPKRKWKQQKWGSSAMGGAVTEDWKGLYQNTGTPFEKVKRESQRRFRGQDPTPGRYRITTDS